eukprot:scaffold35181_cov90-Isochrysis_galbana.AAC.1
MRRAAVPGGGPHRRPAARLGIGVLGYPGRIVSKVVVLARAEDRLIGRQRAVAQRPDGIGVVFGAHGQVGFG